MTSREVCDIMEREILAVYPAATVHKVPVADGGEGSVDSFLAALGGERVPLRVCGPLHTEVDAFYGRLPGGTAVVEMAAAAGLPLVGDTPDPAGATTYGVGQLLLHAAKAGAQKLVVALGGSATTDGG